MSNYPSAPDPDRIPYVPAWLDSTPPQGSPVPPSLPAPDADVRVDRRAPRERSVLLSPLVLGLTLVLVAVVGVGAYLYLRGGDKRAYGEGSCLDDLAGSTPHVVECGTPEAKYQIISIIPDTIDGTQCASLTGSNISMVVNSKDLVCVMDLAR